jgi:hypothetical protein
VILEDNIDDNQVVTDKPEPNFAELAAAALENVGINPKDQLWALQQVEEATPGPGLIKADQDKIVNEITFDFPNAGLAGANVMPANEPTDGDTIDDLAHEMVDILANTKATNRQYPTQSCRGVDRYSPQTTFLQLGEVGVHRSVLNGSKHARMTREERVHATPWTGMTMPMVDGTEHIVDKDLVTESEDKLKVWGYLMTQYNLKSGLQKFGEREAMAAVDELTQLHIMDTWTAMDPSKIKCKDRVQALLSLLFLKEKHTGKIKGRACIN